MSEGLFIPANVTGIRLCKMRGRKFVLCEPVFFEYAAVAIDTVFRRAAISGAVGPIGETGDYWADLMTDGETWVETVALSREAWNAIKNRWARTRVAKG